jgi:hypothetical protein
MIDGKTISRRCALAVGAGAIVAPFLRPAWASTQRPVVVELFTSQGCSSCPAADKLLGEIKRMPGVIALSINVDYWDYLGWRDTLADKSHSQRQYDYARARGDMDVYTPQIVVDGSSHYVGSNRSVVLAAIKRGLESSGEAPVAMSVSDADDKLTVTVAGGAAPSEECTIWMMPVTPEVKVRIDRGENTGRDVVYHNVARNIVPAGMWTGTPVTLQLPKKSLLTPDCTACVALLQPGGVGPIMAAASWGNLSA